MKGRANQLLGLLLTAISSTLLGQITANIEPRLSPRLVVIASASLQMEQSATKSSVDHFVIGSDDVLTINVWKEPEVSRSLPVRSDGRISLPLVGEVQAAGLTPMELEKEIGKRLRSFITEPEVTVMVQKINSEKFNILGQVSKPGSYPLLSGTTVLDAIAAAGGLRDFAKQKSICILRKSPDGGESRITFNYKDVVKGKKPEQNIKLQSNDTVFVP